MAIGWGKPRIMIKELGNPNAKWMEVPTPVEDSVQLTPTKGDKKEAKLEGGDNEDVKYGKNNYELLYGIRVADNKTMPIKHDEGYVAAEYSVALQPENPKVSGFIIDRSAVSVEDPFTTSEGGVWTYAHDALKPEKGKKVKWGIISIEEKGDGFNVTGEGEDFEA